MERKQQHSGKGKESQPAQQNGKASPSLASRIASSASSLAKEFGESTSGNELSNSLASTPSLSSKLQNGSSSSTPSTWTETFPLRNGRPAANGRSSNGHTLPIDEGFRSPSFQHPQDQDFNDFLEGKSGFFHNAMLTANQNLPSWTGEFQHQPWSNGYYSDGTVNPSGPTAGYHGMYSEYDDGADVRMLLSDPDFMMDTHSTDAIEESSEQTAMDLFGEEYSPGEERAADRIKASLPPPPTHQPILPDNPLNLKPDFAPFTATNAAFYQDIPEATSNLGSEDESYMYFTTQSERERLISEWDEVLNSYTDEVWGHMLPAVKEARSQLKEVKSGSKRLDNKAVTRLRMILGHVVQSAHSSLTNKQTSSVDSSSQALRQQGIVDNTWESTQENGTQNAGVGVHQPFLNRSKTNQVTQLYSSESSIRDEMLAEKIHRIEHRHEQRKDSPMMEREADDEVSVPTFHCPWIRCHQRFNNATELRLHTSVHTQYACPHEHCIASFQSHEEWAEHIKGPHHDLLDTGFRSRRDSNA
ncbi:hypothetical protein AOQ84DRAFT_184026 [Glonium stellatum]|uniref:C2H2-type domain-containing protein n=1 Tax=Glonium stellatum TaxID=574774 RepID=A0A8E2JVX9_9PEZI|nr:hypothetical protein AOQ84DRAFT_184026 [Glonium stellatum]